MRIAFGEVDKAGARFSIENDGWAESASEEYIVVAVDLAKVVMRQRDDESLSVTGELAVTLETGCARCGRPVELSVEEDFYYLVTLQEEDLPEHSERECTAEECDTLYLKEPVVDLGEIFTEQLNLSLPGRVLCSEDCAGICPECGRMKGSSECNCSENRSDSPFAILRKLKKD